VFGGDRLCSAETSGTKIVKVSIHERLYCPWYWKRERDQVLWTSSSFNDICREAFIPKAISKEQIFIGNIYMLAQELITTLCSWENSFVFSSDEIAGIDVSSRV
jgi:hypothetical protein